MVRFTSLAAVAFCVFLCGCPTTKIDGRRDIGKAARPATIYVTDFEIDVQDRPEASGSIPAESATPKDPAVRARELIDLMSSSLVQDLTADGLTARRRALVDPIPADGWLVRGIFTRVGEGSRLHRAVVGSGAWQTTLQVIVALDDLAQGGPKRFYELSTSATGGIQPGAAISLKPYVSAARFVLSGGDLDTNVKQTASKIATNIVQLVQEGRGPGK